MYVLISRIAAEVQVIEAASSNRMLRSSVHMAIRKWLKTIHKPKHSAWKALQVFLSIDIDLYSYLFMLPNLLYM